MSSGVAEPQHGDAGAVNATSSAELEWDADLHNSDDGLDALDALDAHDSERASFHDSPQLSPTSVHGDDDTSARPAIPSQKRRRVTRACDECRRKKIKCDGKQPCTHCTVYSYGT
jgi:hypothetical protein